MQSQLRVQCHVKVIEQICTKVELETTYKDMYLRSVSSCNCPAHVNQNPVILPTIEELHSRICLDISELLDWNQDHAYVDKSGNCKALRAFIEQSCLSNKPDSLFSILEKLESIFGENKTDDDLEI